MFNLPSFDPKQEFLLCKEDSDILPLEELRIRIFLVACEYYDGCAATAANHLQIDLASIYSFKENFLEGRIEEKQESPVDEAYKMFAPAEQKPPSSIFFKRLRFFNEGNHFKPMAVLENDIADIAVERYRVISRAAKKLGIEEEALRSLLEKPKSIDETALIILTNRNWKIVNQVAENGLASQFNPYGLNFIKSDDHILTLEEIEKAAIHVAIEHYKGKMTEVARRLKIGRSTLYRKIDEFGIKPPEVL